MDTVGPSRTYEIGESSTVNARSQFNEGGRFAVHDFGESEDEDDHFKIEPMFTKGTLDDILQSKVVFYIVDVIDLMRNGIWRRFWQRKTWKLYLMILFLM